MSEDGGRSRATIALVAIGAILVSLFAIAAIGGTPAESNDPMTVSQFLAARDAGTIGNAQVRVEGYWTNRNIGHSCAPMAANANAPGELQIRCHDGEHGITELAEPIQVMTPDFVVTEARGPHVTPWLDERLWRELDTPVDAPPLPILVLGHVNDARAAACQPAARELCANRLVLDEVLELRR